MLAEQVLALSSLRVYAVCDKSKTLAATVFALSAIPIGTNAVRCRELAHISFLIGLAPSVSVYSDCDGRQR